MRLVAIIALFGCHVEAVKLSTGSPLQGMVNMLDGLIKAAQDETAQLEKDCAADITQLGLTRDSLRADLNRYIAADKVPTKATDGTRGCTGCGGEYDAAEQARAICETEFDNQEQKQTDAKKAMNVHKYNAELQGTNDVLKCSDYGSTAPTETDISVCATEWRIDYKEDQEAEVARQCKKTNEIMEIALNIYKSKGLGASFIQLAQEEGIRADAKQFLEAQTETERNAELLKLLHDFHQQVKRDCHQDISDLKADINALNLHLKSKRNSAASEQRAYEVATQRMHEAQKCWDANLALKNKVHEAAFQTYASFLVICPPKRPDGATGNAEDYKCDDTGPADFQCEWLTQTDRIHADCQGSLMHKHGYCDMAKKEQVDYINSLQQGVETLNMVINGPSAFIQLESEKDAPKEALVQSGSKAVDFGNLVDAIGQAMKNEITKLNADASDVNAFAKACEESLTPLDLPEGQEQGGCTINAGDLCAEQSPLSDTCALCLQEAQCQELGDLAIVAANNEATKQNEEDEAKTLYEEAQQSYASAARKRSEKRAEWARMKADYESNLAGMQQAQTDLQTFADNNQDNANAEAMNNLLGVLNEQVNDLTANWNTYNNAETVEDNVWNTGASSNPNAKAFHMAKTSMECTSANDDIALSHYCDSVAAKTEKIAFAAERSQYENSVFQDCTRTQSTLNKMKAALEARKMQCKVGVTKDLKEELHKMSEALQILQQAKTKIAGTA